MGYILTDSNLNILDYRRDRPTTNIGAYYISVFNVVLYDWAEDKHPVSVTSLGSAESQWFSFFANQSAYDDAVAAGANLRNVTQESDYWVGEVECIRTHKNAQVVLGDNDG